MTVRDEVKEAMLNSLREMNSEMEKNGWDQEPSLWFVYRIIDPLGLSGSFLFRFSQIDTGPILTMGHPSDGLAQMARIISETPFPMPPPENLFAVAFACETWAVSGQSKEEWEKIQEASGKRELHKHPKKVECRMISAVDIAGFIYAVMNARDNAMEPLEYAARKSEQAEGLALDGYVLDSLTTLMEGLIKV